LRRSKSFNQTVTINKESLKELQWWIVTWNGNTFTNRTWVRTLPYLQGLQLAHPVNTDGHFNISLLIGANHYWDIVEDHIIRGNGPTATSSKIGYLLSGPVSHTQSLNVVTNSLHVSTQDGEPCDIQQFWDIETTGTTVENNSDKQFLEEYSQHSITHLPDGWFLLC